MNSLLPSEQSALIDMAKERMGLTSDYKLAQALNWRQNRISEYRRANRSMDIEQVLQFSRRTGISAEQVLEAAVADRRRKSAS